MTDINKTIIPLKALAIIIMVLCHLNSLTHFTYFFTSEPFANLLPSNIASVLLSIAFTGGLIVMTLPVLAGASLAYQVYIEKKITKKTVNAIAIILILSDMIVGWALSSNFWGVVQYNVLSLIGLSYLAIYHLENLKSLIIKNSFIFIFCIFSFLVSSNIEWVRGNLLYSLPEDWNVTKTILSGLRLQVFSILFICSSLLIWLFVKAKFRLLSFISLSFFIIALYFSSFENYRIVEYIRNLPMLMMVGGENNSFIWPFAIWFPSVLFGYYYFKLSLNSKFKKYLAIFDTISLLYLIYYFIYLVQDSFLSKFTKVVSIPNSIFNGELENRLAIISQFVCFCFFIKIVNRFIKLYEIELFKVLSRWILVIYIFHNIFFHYFVKIFKSELTHFQMNFAANLSLIIVLYPLIKVLDKLFHKNKMVVYLKKVDK